jgi:hypothetical protein
VQDRSGNARGKVPVREVRYGAFRRSFQLLRVRVKNVTKPVEPPRKIAIKGRRQGVQGHRG